MTHNEKLEAINAAIIKARLEKRGAKVLNALRAERDALRAEVK